MPNNWADTYQALSVLCYSQQRPDSSVEMLPLTTCAAIFSKMT